MPDQYDEHLQRLAIENKEVHVLLSERGVPRRDDAGPLTLTQRVLMFLGLIDRKMKT